MFYRVECAERNFFEVKKIIEEKHGVASQIYRNMFYKPLFFYFENSVDDAVDKLEKEFS